MNYIFRMFCSALLCSALLCSADDLASNSNDLDRYIKVRDGLPHVIRDIKEGKLIYITTFGRRAYKGKTGINEVNGQKIRLNQVWGAYASYTPGSLGTSASDDCLGYGRSPGFILLDTFSYDQDSDVTTNHVKNSLQLLRNKIEKGRDCVIILSPGKDFLKNYKTEQFKKKVELYEELADASGIPTINLCDYVFDLVSEGIIEKDDCEDGLFNNVQGNAKTVQIFRKHADSLLSSLLNKADSMSTDPDYIQEIEKKRGQLIDKNTINKRVSYEKEEYPEGWLPWQLSNISNVEHCLEGSGTVPYSFGFRGTIIGLSGLSTSDCGDIMYSIDGSDWNTLILCVPQSGTLTYEHLLASGLDKDQDHELKIKPVTPTKKIKIDHFYVTDTIKRFTPNTLEEIDAVYKKIPPLDYKPAASVLDLLPKTKNKLENEKELSILMLGDSIMSGIVSSKFHLLLMKMYPNCKVSVLSSLRGSTGCWYYKEPDNFQQYVGNKTFDLIMIGGISHKNDVDAIKEVVDQVKEKKSDAEIILMTDAWGYLSNLNYEDHTFDFPATQADISYQGKLFALSSQYGEGVAFMDITYPWAQYLRKCKEKNVPYAIFKADSVHANGFGNQVLARIIETYFAPKGYDPCAEWKKQKQQDK